MLDVLLDLLGLELRVLARALQGLDLLLVLLGEFALLLLLPAQIVQSGLLVAVPFRELVTFRLQRRVLLLQLLVLFRQRHGPTLGVFLLLILGLIRLAHHLIVLLVFLDHGLGLHQVAADLVVLGFDVVVLLGQQGVLVGEGGELVGFGLFHLAVDYVVAVALGDAAGYLLELLQDLLV